MSGSLDISLPPLASLSFLPFLLAQAILLHPAVPARPSQILRFLLIFPGVYLAWVTPFRHRIEPAHLSIGVNFRWGIFGPAWVMKALEWGLAVDRSPYTWIGFDAPKASRPKPSRLQSETLTEANAEKAIASGLQKRTNQYRGAFDSSGPATPSTTMPSPPLTPRPDQAAVLDDDIANTDPEKVAKEVSEDKAKEAGVKEILRDGLHLLMAMRCIGYAAGPPLKSLANPTPRSPKLFLQRALKRLVLVHIAATVSLAVIVSRESHLPYFLHRLFPSPALKARDFQGVGNIIACFCVGTSLHAQLELGHETLSIIFLLGTILLRAVLPETLRPAPFDSRQWPPLFKNPMSPKSVTVFWASQWHALFRKPFTAVGYDPIYHYGTPIIGKVPSRLLGAVAVFGLSSWMHDQALISARYNLTPPFDLSHFSFVDRYGGWIFFLGQALAVALEGLSKGRLKGRVWSLCWIVGLGLLAARSWIKMGLVKDVPSVEHWAWQRFLIPSAALAPPPLFTR